MRANEIRNMIEEAVTDEVKTGRLGNALAQFARQNGANPSEQEVQGVVSFVREYIEHVPYYLEQGAGTAKQLGLDAKMDQMLRELETYWFEADDIIPDHLGLMGLMDDAYASLVLLQSLSDYCKATFGRPLLQQNFTQANQTIRGLIGEPGASILEQRVGETVANAMMQHVIGQMLNSGFAFGTGPDPMLDNASTDAIMGTGSTGPGIGALGIV